MANCTYTIRRRGNAAWAEGIATLVDAADARELANRTVCPGHEIFAEYGNETVEVSEDDVQDALEEREAAAS
jgi:hypothetical protein